jgi:putative ABC transport system permease protein
VCSSDLLGEALDRSFYETRRIDTIAQAIVSDTQRTEIAEIDADGKQGRTDAFQVFGADDLFLDQNTIRLQARAEGFADDRAVWQAVKNDPASAVIDGSVVSGINYANIREKRFTLSNYESGDKTFEPFQVVLRDSATDQESVVQIIGIMERGPSEPYRGLWLNERVMLTVLPALNVRYFVRLQPDESAEAEAATMEETLAAFGISVVSITKEIEDQQSLSNAFFLLIQGFLAIGLGVGLIALAVIAFRTVVERRQQIGLLRAIGFTRTNVALSFVLESAFIAVLGILNGIWPALLLANRLLASDQFSAAGFQTFHVPWLQITLMALGVFLASVLTTVIPSQQASRIPPAEALRYE